MSTIKQISSAIIVNPSENNSLKSSRVVVKYADSGDVPSYFGIDYFNNLCARVGLMPAMVYSTPSAFQLTAKFSTQKEGDSFENSDGTKGTAKSTSIRTENASLGMNLQAFGSVMAATAQNAQVASATTPETAEETASVPEEIIEE